MRHYPASNLTPLDPNSLQQVKPKGASDWTSLINGEHAFVMDAGTMRIYNFVAASVAAESIPDVVIPDGNSTGTGRWEQQEFASAAGPVTPTRYFTKPADLANDTWEGDIWTNSRIATGSNAQIGTLLRLRSDGQWVDTYPQTAGGIIGKLGLSLTAGTGTGKEILVKGQANLFSVNDGGFDGGTNGAPIYADTTGPLGHGEMTDVAPTTSGHQVRIVGYKQNNFIIIFDPSPTWIEVA